MIPDETRWPKISIVTPSFNQVRFIEETIRSVLLQGYPSIEFIIIDGGSTDGSLEIIKRYEDWLAYWVSEPDRGQSNAVNKGIQRASGDILFWLNSDDICLRGAFELVGRAFHSNPTSRLVIGQAHMINDRGQGIGELTSNFTTWDELVTNPRNSVRQVSTFFAKNLFDELGMIDESLEIAMDTEILVRFTQRNRPLVLDEYLAAYRVHRDTKTSHQLIRGYAESDHTRLKYLSDARLLAAYQRRSATNWLCLSESSNYSLRERLLCMLHAIRMHPRVILDPNFKHSCRHQVSHILDHLHG